MVEHSAVFFLILFIISGTVGQPIQKVALFCCHISFTGRRNDGDGILTDEGVDWNESS